jgi:hypothetical protein
MKVYILGVDDQRRDNWIINRWFRRKDGVPDFTPLTVYRDCVCSGCRKIAYDDAFKLGFKAAKKIRGKGDMLTSDDGFRCVRENVVALLDREGIRGVHFRQIVDTEWYVLNITERVRVSGDVYQRSGVPCSLCGRKTEVLGAVTNLGQFLDDLPRGAVFSTSEYNEKWDREILIDETILELFRKSGITGCTAQLIPPADEYKKLSDAWKRGEKVKLVQVHL